MATQYPAPGTSKSIQRGRATATVAISAVNPAKSKLTVNGAASSSNNPENASLFLTNATTITYSKGSLGGTPELSWELEEFF